MQLDEAKGRERRIGTLEPEHTLFLNPYSDARFTRCPRCNRPTKMRKKPFFIHMDPAQLVILNMTARYCPTCDLLVLHQGVVEDLLPRAFEDHNPEVIGNDYLVMGAVERSYWRKHKGQATLDSAIAHLHDFKSVVQYSPLHYGWVPDEYEQDKEHV